MTFVKIIAWLWAITGSLYFFMYQMGNEIVVKNAVGPVYLLMVVAPVLMTMLVLTPIASRLGVLGD